MKKMVLAALLLGLSTTPCMASNPVLQAMKDELKRSMQGLKLPPSPAPYWMAYRVSDIDGFALSASRGALTQDSHVHRRLAGADVRIGSFQLDSGPSMPGPTVPVTLEDNYDTLRTQLWRLTDQVYKRAITTYSRRESEVKQRAHPPTTADFSPAAPVTHLESTSMPPADPSAWRGVVRQLSAGFRRYPELVSSEVQLDYGVSTTYFVTSEGTTVKSGFSLGRLVMRAEARTEDGKVLRDFVTWPVHRLQDLPTPAVMAQARDALGGRLTSLCHAPTEKRYIGPVLITQQAAPQFLAQILGSRLSGAPGAMDMAGSSELGDRLQRRILPTSLDLVDDPGLSIWLGMPVFGNYAVDGEGVPAQRVVLVHEGRLKTLLMGRRPAPGFPHSNGHARTSASVTFSNLIFSAQNGDTPDDLKRKLRDECRKQELPYGLMVRNLEDVDQHSMGGPMAALLGRLGVSGPMLVYRVDTATGKERLVRTGPLGEVNLRTLRDIMAVGRDAFSANYLGSAMDGAPPSTVVAPSLLLEELEFQPYQGEESASRPLLQGPVRQPDRP